MSELVLTNGTYDKITEYVRQIDAEIGMFGYVTLDDGDFYVDEVFLVKQEVSGSSVDFADAGLEYAINRAVEDDRINDLKFCCHSHVDMDAFWSTTDDKMIAGMNNGMTPYLVSLVINKRHDTQQRVDFFNPPEPLAQFTNQLRFDLDLVVESEDNAAIADEIAELVTHRKYFTSSRSRRYDSYRSRQDWTNNDDTNVAVVNAAGDITGYLRPDDMTEEEWNELTQLEAQAWGTQQATLDEWTF